MKGGNTDGGSRLSFMKGAGHFAMLEYPSLWVKSMVGASLGIDKEGKAL
jgi:hypothetical protein